MEGVGRSGGRRSVKSYPVRSESVIRSAVTSPEISPERASHHLIILESCRNSQWDNVSDPQQMISSSPLITLEVVSRAKQSGVKCYPQRDSRTTKQKIRHGIFLSWVNDQDAKQNPLGQLISSQHSPYTGTEVSHSWSPPLELYFCGVSGVTPLGC